MVYLLNGIFSVLYFLFIKKYKFNFWMFLPIFCIWVFIIGFQYNTGTDYFSYLGIYNSSERLILYYNKRELIFYYIIKYLQVYFTNGQIFFIVVAIVENSLLYFILKSIYSNKIWIFVLLFLFFGTNFYNQMNGIRQFFNIYLLYFLVLFAFEKKYIKFIIIYVIGINIHRSFMFFFPCLVIKFIVDRLNKRILMSLLLTGSIICIFPFLEYASRLIMLVPRYAHYVYYDYFRAIGFEGKIVKLCFFPFFIDACRLIGNLKSQKDEFFLKFGILSYAFRIACLVSSVTNRFGEYFVFFTIFPLYFLLEYYIQNKKKGRLILFLFLLFILFLIKVLVFPKGEYLYRTYLFSRL